MAKPILIIAILNPGKFTYGISRNNFVQFQWVMLGNSSCNPPSCYFCKLKKQPLLVTLQGFSLIFVVLYKDNHDEDGLQLEMLCMHFNVRLHILFFTLLNYYKTGSLILRRYHCIGKHIKIKNWTDDHFSDDDYIYWNKFKLFLITNSSLWIWVCFVLGKE